MSLSSLLHPLSIAVIGASDDPMSIRGRPLRLLRERGYPGRVVAVNRSATPVQGIMSVKTIAEAGTELDVALVVVPSPAVVDVVEQCAESGVKNAVVVSSGFAEERSDAGRIAQARLAHIAASSSIRILGPNTQGLFSLYDRAPITFSPFVGADGGILETRTGPVAIVSQSGGLGFSLFHTGENAGIGFSYVIATGNEVDVDCLELADAVLEDPNTEVIVLLFEGLRDPTRLRHLAVRSDMLGKHLLAAKLGCGSAGMRAAYSHTAHLAGSDAVYQAVFKQLGILHVSDPDELLDLALALPTTPSMKGRRVGVVTTSGGTGVWLADALESEGLIVPELPLHTQKRLMARMPSFGSPANPVDLTAEVVRAGGFADAVEELLAAGVVDAVVACMALSHAPLLAREREHWKRIAAESNVPLVMYTRTLPSEESIEILKDAGIPWCTTPRRAATLLSALANSGMRASSIAVRGDRSGEAPKRLPVYLLDKQTHFEANVKRLLTEWGVCVPKGELVDSASGVRGAADRIGYPVALKVQGPDLVHKTELGLVALNVPDSASAADAASRLFERASRVAPGSELAGVLVEKMAPEGIEAIVGVVRDNDFGPVVLVGAGGLLTELISDVALGVAPISSDIAAQMIGSLKLSTVLDGNRGAGPYDAAALARLIVQVSHFALAYRDSFSELDLNPVIVHPRGSGLTVVDAWITSAEAVPDRGSEVRWTESATR